MTIANKLTIPRSFFACLIAGLLLSGCAVDAGAPSRLTPPAVARENASINYVDAQAQAQLSQSGLLQPFTEYWDAHARRDWIRLHSFEVADAPISPDFYIPYHARAWHVTNIEVLTLEYDASEARLTLGMTLRNPDDGKTRFMHRQDKWVRIDSSWRHWVTDPMLTGNR